jgi:hypothetical protein
MCYETWQILSDVEFAMSVVPKMYSVDQKWPTTNSQGMRGYIFVKNTLKFIYFLSKWTIFC